MSIDPLAKDDLMRILTEPRNAITKQYVEVPVAGQGGAGLHRRMRWRRPPRRRWSSRLARAGLRTIIEEVLLDVMYEIPSRSDVRKCIITADTIKTARRHNCWRAPSGRSR